MNEPHIPLPPPEASPYWDPMPARCPVPGCRQIIDAHPADRQDGRWEGRCPNHGMVAAHYGDSPNPENPFQQGPACPDCGSARTTIYPLDDVGNRTLYCDECKREEQYILPGEGEDDVPGGR